MKKETSLQEEEKEKKLHPKETSPRTRITSVILVAFLIIWILVGVPLLLFGSLEFVLWSTLMALIALFALLASLTGIKPATMILSTFMGDIDKLDARTGNATRGIAGTHFVLNFPPPLAQAIILPMGAFTVPFKPINATTQEVGGAKDSTKENFTPVIGIVQFTIQLPTNLEKLVKMIEVIDFVSNRDTNDLTQKTPTIFYRPKENGMGFEAKEQDCFRIAKVFSTLLQPTVDEALSQVIVKYPLSAALQNRSEIEKAFIKQLKAGDEDDGTKRPSSIIEKAGLLGEKKDKGEDEGEDEEIFFNLNLVDISIADPETAQSISAGTKERYTAKGVIQKARGEKKAEIIRSKGAAAAITNRAKAVADGGPAAVQVLAAQAIADASSENTTFVAGLNLLEAASAALIKNPPQQVPKQESKP